MKEAARVDQFIAATKVNPFCQISFSQDNGENYDQYNNEQNYNGNASPFAGVLLVLPRNLQLLHPTSNVRISSRHVALYIIQLFPLGLDQHRHVQEHLVQLIQIPLYLFHRVMPLLNLLDRVQNASPPLLLDRFL